MRTYIMKGGQGKPPEDVALKLKKENELVM